MKLRHVLLTLGAIAIAAGQSANKAILVNLDTANWSREKGSPAGSEGAMVRADQSTGGIDLNLVPRTGSVANAVEVV